MSQQVTFYADLLSFIIDLRTLVGGLIIAVLWLADIAYTKRKKHLLRKLLSIGIHSNKCVVAIPEFRAEILKKERRAAIYDEVELLSKVSMLLSQAGIVVVPNMREPYNEYSEIQIGGPVSNAFTNLYFSRYLKDVIWYVSEHHMQKYLADENLQSLLNVTFIKTCDDHHKYEGFQIGDDFYPYIPDKIGWSILVKIIDQSEHRKVIHLLFGCGTNGTIGSVDYLVYQYSKIYSMKKESEYFGIFQVNGKGQPVEDITWLDEKRLIHHQ